MWAVAFPQAPMGWLKRHGTQIASPNPRGIADKLRIEHARRVLGE